MLNNSHPGKILRVEVMEPLGLTVEDAARRFGISPDLLAATLAGRSPISQALADGLERAGYSTARFWLAL